MTGAVERTTLAWHGAPPDWVLALAEACEVESQARVARRIGYKPSTLSQVLANKYGAGLDAIERTVRDAFAGTTVVCPGLQGEQISALRCRDLQAMKSTRAAGNPTLSRVWRACRGGCPHSLLPQPKETDRA